jgi:23S rRNA (guanosine2251-2'-O)-methyltransferase
MNPALFPPHTLKVLFGFHAVGVRLRMAPQSVRTLYVDAMRHDARMQTLVQQAKTLGCTCVSVTSLRLSQLCGSLKHQGVVAQVDPLPQTRSLDELLDGWPADREPPLLLVLDGVTDPHNLGACLRVADAAGVHAVLAPKDRCVGINATVEKVASGAAQTMPYFMVTNLARTLVELQDWGMTCIGTSDQADTHLYGLDLRGPLAWVLGAEGHGLRPLTQKRCDRLVRIPMCGEVESLNVSVASGVCLYETRRQRGF